jgi:hypothetical protein
MSSQGIKKIASAYLGAKGRTKTAGEVIFRKDMGGDANQWAFAGIPPSQRHLNVQGFEWNPKNIEPLARVLRSTAAALGHTFSAYETFAKLKSSSISPDGSLGGKGYIQKVTDMRRQFMNVIEALSAHVDTLSDELKGPQWLARADNAELKDEKEKIQNIMEDVEEIKKDPKGWAEGAEEEMD